MKQYILNGQNMSTREAAHDEIQRVLPVPDYYGRNLDALWDVVSCLEGEIVLKNNAALTVLGEYGEKLCATFMEASQENSLLTFRIEE